MERAPIGDEYNLDETEDAPIFESQEHFKKEILRFCYGDLCVIGRLWIQALRTVLVGANFSIIPVVKAAPTTDAPKKPPKMKYKDLPIYECPHHEYKEYLEDQRKCPKANVKILHTYIFPKVQSYRKSWVDSITDFKKDATELKDDACAVISKNKNDFITFMRCRDNFIIRQAMVATGTATGFFIGRGTSAIRRLFFTSLGALSTGALCFPKETDEIIRDASYRVGKVALTVFNSFCGMNIVLREKLPCRDEMPPPPPPRPDNQKNKCREGPKK